MIHHAINVPTLLTLTRLLISSLVLPIFLVYLLPYNFFWLNLSLAFLFVVIGSTDFFDGYLARKLQQETSLGKMLDPIADKFLLYATLVSLVVVHKIYFYWVIILIGREFFVMGLRLIALENNFSVAVSSFGKLKTSIQLLLLAVLIANPYQSLGVYGAPYWNYCELSLLALSIILSLFSADRYYDFFMRQFNYMPHR